MDKRNIAGNWGAGSVRRDGYTCPYDCLASGPSDHDEDCILRSDQASEKVHGPRWPDEYKTRCHWCREPIRRTTIDPQVPWVHNVSGNAGCDRDQLIPEFSGIDVAEAEPWLNGNETAEEFAAGLFEFELCWECFGATEDHEVTPDPLGLWHAWCTYKAPRMMQFVITFAPGKGQQRAIRLEVVDTGEVIAETFASPAARNHTHQRLTFGSAVDITDAALQVAACELLHDYREKKHNES